MKGAVYNNGKLAGHLERNSEGVISFRYTDEYYMNPIHPPISLTLPKTQQVYESKILFAFFQGLLSEGVNKEIQCRLLKIDEKDDFTRLLQTAGDDTIGAITVKLVEE